MTRSNEVDTLVGKSVSLIYFGMMRVTEVYSIRKEKVNIGDDKIQVTYEVKNKRMKREKKFVIPGKFRQLFVDYLHEIDHTSMDDRFVRRMHIRTKKRVQRCEKGAMKLVMQRFCALLKVSDKVYNIQSVRRTAELVLIENGAPAHLLMTTGRTFMSVTRLKTKEEQVKIVNMMCHN